MASGDTLCVFRPTGAHFPASNYATLDTRNNIPVLDFDDSTDETAYFHGLLPANYAGGGVTVDLYWMATSATSGACYWQTNFEREDLVTDHDSNGFGSANSGNGTAPGTSGYALTTSIAHTHGAQMDFTVAGEPFRLAVNRDADNGSDNMTGDAELLMVVIRET